MQTPCVNTEALNREIRLNGNFEDALEAFEYRTHLELLALRAGHAEDVAMRFEDIEGTAVNIIAPLLRCFMSASNAQESHVALWKEMRALMLTVARFNAKEAEPELAIAAGV